MVQCAKPPFLLIYYCEVCLTTVNSTNVHLFCLYLENLFISASDYQILLSSFIFILCKSNQILRETLKYKDTWCS